MERASPRAEPLLGRIEDVYRNDYPRFLRLALAMLGDRERARDAVQETFARAIRGRRDFRGEGSLEGWLWRTLTNHCHDLLRAPSTTGELPDLASSHNHRPLEHAELRAAIAALPAARQASPARRRRRVRRAGPRGRRGRLDWVRARRGQRAPRTHRRRLPEQ